MSKTLPSEQASFILNNGKKFPKVGLGTSAGNDKEGEDMVYNAIKIGYRHIDTAAIYGNEAEVGAGISRAIADKLVTREELFVVTKLWSDRHRDVAVAMEESLQRLGLSYVDLYLVHWPIAWKRGTNLVDEQTTLEQVWPQMEALVEAGKAISIGVSNYNCEEILDLVKYAKIQPVVNQVEIHPYFNNAKLQKVCNDNGIILTAYSALMPLATNYKYIEWADMAADPVVLHVAAKHNVSPQQALLRWNLDAGNSVITKSSKVERLQQNFAILDFELDQEDMAQLSKLTRTKRYRNPHDFKMPVEQWFFKDE